jgi:hypothetical protein
VSETDSAYNKPDGKKALKVKNKAISDIYMRMDGYTHAGLLYAEAARV